jgi:hypothetical protein
MKYTLIIVKLEPLISESGKVGVVSVVDLAFVIDYGE